MKNKLIELKNIKKSFGNKLVLNNITFDILEGEVLAYVGPNGSGKTTTINILLDLLKSDKGKVEYNFTFIQDFREQIGSILSLSVGYDKLTVYDNLLFFAKIRKIDNIENKIMSLLELTNLTDQKNNYISELSSGMKKKFELCISLINDSKLIIMDEPSNSLDVDSKEELKNIIRELNKQGKTIFISSHDLEMISDIADRFIFLKKGEIILTESMNDLSNIMGGKKVHLDIDRDNSLFVDIRNYSHNIIVDENKDKMVILTTDKEILKLINDSYSKYIIRIDNFSLLDAYRLSFQDNNMEI